MAMKTIINNTRPEDTILKFNDWKGFSSVIKSADIEADENGRKIVKAGTPLPTNDSNAKGLLLHTVDVTHGDEPVSLVYEGAVDNKKLSKNGITVSDLTKTALPRITFFD